VGSAFLVFNPHHNRGGIMKRISNLLLLALVLVTSILCNIGESVADNYALRFDGDDYVIVPNSPSLNPSQITVKHVLISED